MHYSNLPLPDLHVVGGSVRDHILGNPSQDIDLATSATPEEMLEVAGKEGLKAIPTGIDHGTITFLLEGEPFEVTTFRKDVATDGRRATVKWADTIEEDLARRDFRMNAMARNLTTGELVDPFNGQRDIAENVIRAVGRPEDRIREDYLRIVRAARFAARFYWDVEAGLARAMRAMGPSVAENVSVERLVEETNKVFYQSRSPQYYFNVLHTCGVLEDFMPWIAALRGKRQNPRWHPEGDAYQHTMDVVRRAEPRMQNGWAVGRWCALFHDVGKGPTAEPVPGERYFSFHGHEAKGAEMIGEIARRLKLPNWLRSVLKDVTRHHMRPLHAQNQNAPISDAQVRRFQRSAKHLEELKALCIADAGDRRPDAIDQLFQELPEPVEPVLMGRHLIDAGYEPGPQFGPALEAAFDHQLETGCTDLHELLTIAESTL